MPSAAWEFYLVSFLMMD